MSEPTPPSAPPLPRRAATVALAVVALVGFLLVTAVVVVRGVLLDAGTYRSALVEADAYERTYTEVFADPDLAAVKDELIGSLAFGIVDPTQVRAKATAALRWTVPPSTLQRGAETVIDATLAYVRGDVDRLDGGVDVAEVLERVAPTAVVEASASLAEATTRVAPSLDTYRVALADALDELAAGRVPAALPIADTDIDRAAVIDAIIDAVIDELGPVVDDDLRLRITAAVLADEERTGLIEAAAPIVAQHASRVADGLRSASLPDGELDLVAAVADRAQQPTDRVVATLDDVRDVAARVPAWLAVLGAVLAIAAIVGIVVLHRRDPRRAGKAVGWTLLTAAAVVAVGWLAIGVLTDPPLAAATGTGPGTWNLPTNLRVLIADVQGHVGDDLTDAVRRTALVLAVAGLAVLVVATLSPPDRRRAAHWLAGAGAVVLVVGIGGSLVAANVGTDGARACNGHEELCGRRYDEVVYAATHNSMSSPDVVAVWPEHDGNIAQQLDAGVRALLIDAKYWTTVRSGQALAEAEPLLPPALADVVFGTLGDRTRGRDGTFLCHIHCAFGEIDFTEAMVGVRQFLEANPHEVVTFVLQDEIAPSDTEQVMRASGLEPYLYVHDGGDWPTLGEMIDDGTRLVVLAENEGPPPAWHHDGFDLMQETPFLFREPEDMSCVENRGNPDATLFQMNHWVQRAAPDRVDAVVVNAHDFIVERARRCQAERGLLPNFVGVNFYNIGDLMEAVDTLNGVG